MAQSLTAGFPQGAVYVTNNAAYSWTAAVQESVDATLNRTVSSGALRCLRMKCSDPLQSCMRLLHAALVSRQQISMG